MGAVVVADPKQKDNIKEWTNTNSIHETTKTINSVFRENGSLSIELFH